MSKFKVGDKVVCRRPANENMKVYVGKSGVITSVFVDEFDICLRINGVFKDNGVFTSEQFDLVRQMEENE